MRRCARAAFLTIGLTLLVFAGMSPPAFAPPPHPPSPPPGTPERQCEVTSVSIQGPSEGTVGESLSFQGKVQTKDCPGKPQYNWSLQAAPPGAEPWSTTGQEVSFVPRVVGEYLIKLEVTADSTGEGSAEHLITVRPSEVQEYALILGPGSELRAFPGRLLAFEGNLRLFFTSLERSLKVIIRREGAQAGIAAVLVEPGKLATVEIELVQGIYQLLVQGADTVLGQIEVR